MNNAFNIPKIPGLPSQNNSNNYDIGGGYEGVFSTGKNSVIKRDSVNFKPSDSGLGGAVSSNYRNNQVGIQNTLPQTTSAYN